MTEKINKLRCVNKILHFDVKIENPLCKQEGKEDKKKKKQNQSEVWEKCWRNYVELTFWVKFQIPGVALIRFI